MNNEYVCWNMTYRDALTKSRREESSCGGMVVAFSGGWEGLPGELTFAQGAPVCKPGRRLAGLALG